MKTYHFPGNIRELRAMVIDAVGSHKAMMLSLKPFKEAIGDQKGRTSDPTSIVTFSDNLPTLKQFEQILIEEALERSGSNQTIAAQRLGISRQALNNRLQRKRK